MSRQLMRKRRSQAGYTLVELMMAVALFVAGMVALLGMQKVAVSASTSARNLTVGQRIAQTWSSQLQLDAVAWRDNLTNTEWLSQVGGGWIRPQYEAGRVGAAFDALGNPITTTAELVNARYCTNIRLSYLYPPDRPVSGNGLMRAEIRVYWLRDDEAVADAAKGLCPETLTAAELKTVGESVGRYQFVYQTVGVRQRGAI